MQALGRSTGGSAPDLPAILSPAEQGLFRLLPPSAQQHSRRVAARIAATHPTDLLLLRAAWLHDVGKCHASITLPHRVVYVLLDRLLPKALESKKWDRQGLLAPLFVLQHHGPLGARLLEAIGTEAELVELVRRHHQPTASDDDRLRALMTADELE